MFNPQCELARPWFVSAREDTNQGPLLEVRLFNGNCKPPNLSTFQKLTNLNRQQIQCLYSSFKKESRSHHRSGFQLLLIQLTVRGLRRQQGCTAAAAVLALAQVD